MTNAANLVSEFIRTVRSGRHPGAAARYLAPIVLAHEIRSEGRTTTEQTPADYAAHVRELLELFGNFTLQIEELIAQGGGVFVRWKQRGWHCGSINGEVPTGKPLFEQTSAVYRVEGGMIVEYWLQTDRKGLEAQLDEIAG